MKKYYNKMKRWVKKPVHKAIKQEASPHNIAISFAIGSFIAIFPTFGLGILVVLFIMLFYKDLNKIAAIAGLAFWNLLMMLPIFWLSYNLGRAIYGFFEGNTTLVEGTTDVISTDNFSLSELHIFFSENSAFIKEYLTGNLILAVSLSFISYFIIKETVIVYRKAKEKKLLKKLKRSKKAS